MIYFINKSLICDIFSIFLSHMIQSIFITFECFYLYFVLSIRMEKLGIYHQYLNFQFKSNNVSASLYLIGS